MKKLTLLLAALAFLFAGCSGEQEEPQYSEDAPASAQQQEPTFEETTLEETTAQSQQYEATSEELPGTGGLTLAD
jgi:PBP1b-binding outer membrane lipoprotein LpoB